MTTYAGSVDYAVGVDFTAGARSGTRTATVDFGISVAFTATTRPTITDARLVVVDKDGAVYGELGDATLTDLSWALSDIESFSFSLPASSGQVALLTASTFREVQIWWGNWLACWGPVTRMDLDGDILKCSGAGAPWYLQRRYLSDERTNLITNPTFDQGKSGWGILVQDTVGGFVTYSATSTDCYWEVVRSSVGSSWDGWNYARLVDVSGNIDDDADYQEPFLFQDVTVTGGSFGTWYHLSGYCWISAGEYVEPNQREWGLVLARMPTTYTRFLGLYTQSLDHTTSRIDDETPREQWVRQECRIFVPANQTEVLHCRLTGVHGVTRWDAITLYADDGLEYLRTDQAAIISGIVAATQADTGDLNLSVAIIDPSINRDRQYVYSEHPNVWRSVTEFTNLADGVDLRTDYTPTDRILTPAYPRAGIHRPALRLTADDRGGNIEAWSWRWDGETATSAVTVLGEGSGPTRAEGYASSTSTFPVVLEEVVTALPETTDNDLSGQASERLAVAAYPDVLTVVVPAAGFLGILRVGDTVPVRIEQGSWVLADTFRVVRMSWQNDRLALDLNRRTL